MPDLVFLLGPAGSGKTTLTAALAQYFDQKRLWYATVNLDPAVEDASLKYNPTIDARDWVRWQDVVAKYELGPNGAIIVSMDLLATHAREIREAVEELKPDYVIIDTPGQLEVFAFRPSGYVLFKELMKIEDARGVIVFLIDPALCLSGGVNAILSVLLLSSAIFWRFQLPVVDVLTKRDMLSPEQLDQILAYLEQPSRIFDELDAFPLKDVALTWEAMVSQFEDVFARSEIIAVSAVTGEGIPELVGKLQEVLSKSGGEEV